MDRVVRPYDDKAKINDTDEDLRQSNASNVDVWIGTNPVGADIIRPRHAKRGKPP